VSDTPLCDAVKRLARDPKTDAALGQWFRLLLRGEVSTPAPRVPTRPRARPAVGALRPDP
jgi:hypothetical protein